MPLPARIALFALPVAAVPLPAFAHLGHVGEVAGHGHWLGYGALVAAAAALALLAKQRRREEKAEENDAGPAGAPDADNEAEETA